jgi:hypothetical protein
LGAQKRNAESKDTCENIVEPFFQKKNFRRLKLNGADP